MRRFYVIACIAAALFVSGCAVIPSDAPLDEPVNWYEYHRGWWDNWSASGGKAPIWHTAIYDGIYVVSVPIIAIYKTATWSW